MAAAIFAVANAGVFSMDVNSTLTPPTVITPGIGLPEKVTVCDSPTGPEPNAALRLMAAALAIAEPAALFKGE